MYRFMSTRRYSRLAHQRRANPISGHRHRRRRHLRSTASGCASTRRWICSTHWNVKRSKARSDEPHHENVDLVFIRCVAGSRPAVEHLYNTAIHRRYRVFVVGCRVQVIVFSQSFFANTDITLQNKDLLAARIIVPGYVAPASNFNRIVGARRVASSYRSTLTNTPVTPVRAAAAIRSRPF